MALLYSVGSHWLAKLVVAKYNDKLLSYYIILLPPLLKLECKDLSMFFYVTIKIWKLSLDAAVAPCLSHIF